MLDFIERSREGAPTIREIAAHFGFKSPRAAADHVNALRRKGFLAGAARRARSLRVVSPWQALRRRVVDIPLLGSIPAGFGQDREQEALGCVSVDMATVGIKPSARTFALEVHGDSMIGRHIVEGDVVVLEHGAEPRPGEIVAALIDGESTLKTFVRKNNKAFLKAENPKYPDFIPAEELMIQGVFRALIRRSKE